MKLILTTFSLLFCLATFAQQKTITGVVIDKDFQSPIAGVTVKTAT